MNLFSKISASQFSAIAALIVSVCALFVSIQEARLMRIQQEAAIYPHLVAGPSYDGDGFGLRLKNSGTGLAQIESMKVWTEEIYFSNWIEVMDHFLPEGHNVGYNMMNATDINQMIVSPGEVVNLMRLPWTDTTRILLKHIQEIQYEICYCSLLGKCWKVHSELRKPVPATCFFEEGKEF